MAIVLVVFSCIKAYKKVNLRYKKEVKFTLLNNFAKGKIKI